VVESTGTKVRQLRRRRGRFGRHTGPVDAGLTRGTIRITQTTWGRGRNTAPRRITDLSDTTAGRETIPTLWNRLVVGTGFRGASAKRTTSLCARFAGVAIIFVFALRQLTAPRHWRERLAHLSHTVAVKVRLRWIEIFRTIVRRVGGLIAVGVLIADKMVLSFGRADRS
jgi:hypothetical protein